MNIDILFGKSTKTITHKGGVIESFEQTLQNGVVVSTTWRVRETVKIADEPQILREFLALLNDVKHDEHKFDPTFELVTDKKTGRYTKAYRSWSIRE